VYHSSLGVRVIKKKKGPPNSIAAALPDLGGAGGSEEASYTRLIDFVSLNSRLEINNNEEDEELLVDLAFWNITESGVYLTPSSA